MSVLKPPVRTEAITAEESGQAEPVRVLIIGPSMDILGGQAVQVADLLEILQPLKHLNVTFFPINPRPPKFLSWVRDVRYLRTLVTFVLYFSRLVFEARKHQVIHIFSAGLTSYSLWTIPALYFGRLYKKKLILNYHDGQAEQHLRDFPSARKTMAWADRIITPSFFLVDVFAKHGIKANSIFNIIETNRFHYRRRRQLRPIFMTNRILEPLYNVDCILRAFQIIQGHYADATLTIAHDGVCRPALERLAQELQLKNTQFIGKVPHDRVADLYDAADIYVTSPNIDCMPVSLLESFASGIPIVATAAGGIPYISKDRVSALHVPINDHEALAARCIELLENPDLVTHITDGGQEEVKKYHWKPVQTQWAALYTELAAEEKVPVLSETGVAH
jgi:L-malate glycosyltransferase